MNIRKLSCILLFLAGAMARAQDHGHLNAGAATWNPGEKLVWANGADFLQSSGYVKTLVLQTNTASKYFGFYDGNITLTALHSTNAFGEPITGSPAPGSFILAELASFSGPEGGQFGLWLAASTAGNPTFSVPTGTENAGHRYDLSDSALGAGLPGGDPFGHLHGRRMTLNKPGIYTVGFRAIDVSTNGPGGGPIHPASEELRIQFQAGYNIKAVSLEGSSTRVTVGTQTGFIFKLQSSLDLNNPFGWTDVAEVTGNDLFQTIVDENAGSASRFYRIEVRPSAP